MNDIKVALDDFTSIEIKFSVQKRRTHGMQVMRDTICYGMYECSVLETASMYVPAVTHQSTRDTYDRFRGIEESLHKFFRRNPALTTEVRQVIWEQFHIQKLQYMQEMKQRQQERKERRKLKKGVKAQRDSHEHKESQVSLPAADA